MKSLFDEVSYQCSRMTTRAYSTSFSLGILFLNKKIRKPIYNIYGFVRFADEIVDSFHDYDQETLLAQFKEAAYLAIFRKLSLNPILNSFQETVHEYQIDINLIDTFLQSMEMDLSRQKHSQKSYEEYILGSAEVVGLMCLKVFTEGDQEEYERLKPFAMKLGAAFQKINFLRDLRTDFEELGRNYFPDVDLSSFNKENKLKIEKEIEEDFDYALQGIKKLPRHSRKGVYLAYVYYRNLFRKIKRVPAERVMKERIRIPNTQKVGLMFTSLVRHQTGLL